MTYIEEYNRLWDFWCWYSIKPEYGGHSNYLKSKDDYIRMQIIELRELLK